MIKRVFSINIILMIILASFVIAAGSSTNNRRNAVNGSSSNSTNEVNCEDRATLRERIKCRLDNPGNAYAYGLEEACRGLANQQACERLYNRSKSCYDFTSSTEKKKCLLNESGINFNAGGAFRAAPTEAKRNYVILLLYELQRRIEKMQETGKITSDQATSLITKIVEIKRMILAGEKRPDIVVKINEFKREYKSVVLGIGGGIGRGNNSTNVT